MSLFAAGWKAGEVYWFYDTERDEPSINVCPCGEPIPEEVGHCWECENWATALQRESDYNQRLWERSMREKTTCAECFAFGYSEKVEEEGRLLCRRCQTAGWDDTALYCPHCGRQGLQVDHDPGDYYVGSEYRCPGCKKISHLP